MTGARVCALLPDRARSEGKGTVAMKAKVKVTYEDYRHMHEARRCKLLEGELVTAASPIAAHQHVLRKLGSVLTPLRHCEGEARGNLREGLHCYAKNGGTCC